MKPDIESMPIEIFDLIAKASFDKLDKDQQWLVLKYLTAEEFNELFISNGNIVRTLLTGKSSQAVKADLMQRFDEAYHGKTQQFNFTSSFLWKAACVLLLFSTLWFASGNKEEKIDKDAKVVIKLDTIYRDRPVAVARTVRDTVYISKSIETIPTKRKLSNEEKTKMINESKTAIISQKSDSLGDIFYQDLEILTASRLDKVLNTPKRNSMHDDSLERNFKFVGI